MNLPGMDLPAGVRRRQALWGLLAVVAVTGCSGTQPRLFVLTPIPAGNGPARGRGNRAISVQPVTMPDYLDRPEIVSYASTNELSASRDDQWAERLPTNITRVLAENLSVLLGTDRVQVMPSRRGDRTDYEVSVAFDRFSRAASGQCVLDAQWAILDGATQKTLARDRTRIATPVADGGYPALVAAMNENLTALSRDIAEAIANLPHKGGNRNP